MIQLFPVPRPDELTDDKVRELTEKYKADKTQRVWNQTFIKEALLRMSSGKCCYCECRLKDESNYLEVEHFHPKKLYPDEVLDWENLLPSCARCNRTKRDHDPKTASIVHPLKDNPKAHFELNSTSWFKGTSEVGKTTIRVLNLNDILGPALKRFEVSGQVKTELNNLEIGIREYLAGVHIYQKQSRILNTLQSIMQRGQPTERYSATVATEILREDSYHFAKAELSKLGLWDADFQHLENELTKIAF